MDWKHRLQKSVSIKKELLSIKRSRKYFSEVFHRIYTPHNWHPLMNARKYLQTTKMFSKTERRGTYITGCSTKGIKKLRINKETNIFFYMKLTGTHYCLFKTLMRLLMHWYIKLIPVSKKPENWVIGKKGKETKRQGVSGLQIQ